MDPINPARTLLHIHGLSACGEEITLLTNPVQHSVPCPDCKQHSSAVHRTHQRRPIDLPWGGRPTRLVIRARHFRCLNPDCPRRIFAESFPGLLPRYARRTQRATDLLLAFAVADGGEAGARNANRIGLPTSADTLLRLLRRATLDIPTPRALGVDEFALLKGRRYGTILYDLEAHRPVDLLQDREGASLAEWLRNHPGVQIAGRDRFAPYAQGIAAGAPDAVQVVDRWHLLRNATEAMDALQRQRRRMGSPAFAVTLEAAEPAERPEAANWQVLFSAQRTLEPYEQGRLARLERWEEVQQLRQEGNSMAAIAKRLGLTERQVRRDLEQHVPPTTREYPACPRALSPFFAHLRKRLLEGCQDASQLHQEIAAQGYQGKQWSVRMLLQAWRGRDSPRRKAGQKRLRWLLLRVADQLKDEERKVLEAALAADAKLAKGYELLRSFRALITERDLASLERWLGEASASGLEPFEGFAEGLVDDIKAVRAALICPWSTGPVEGEITKVKLIKRQGYGRAKPDLLRKRVLLSA